MSDADASLILIIEDDPVVCRLVEACLSQEGMTVIAVQDGYGGLRAVAESRPALVLLDVNLPDIDGWAILRRLRTDPEYQPPVIMLTNKSDEPDRVLGLDLGADDYVPKPFSGRELAARVRAVLRRAGPARAGGNELVFPGLRIDVGGRLIWREGEEVHLTLKEFDLLSMLAKRPSQVFTRSFLYDRIWGDAGQGDEHTLDVHVDRVRRKLSGSDGWNYVRTIKGVGFKFHVPPEDSQ